MYLKLNGRKLYFLNEMKAKCLAIYYDMHLKRLWHKSTEFSCFAHLQDVVVIRNVI